MQMIMEYMKNKKRLLSLTPILSAVLAAVVIANIVVWAGYLQQRARVDSLTGEIAGINENIQQLAMPSDDLKTELESVQAAMAAATAVFPDSVNRNEVMDFILDMADSCGVQVMPLVCEGWCEVKAGASYRVLKFSGAITGSMNDTTDFIYQLQNSQHKTLTVQDIVITSQARSYPEIPVDLFDIPVTVSLSIGVYTCQQAVYEDAV